MKSTNTVAVINQVKQIFSVFGFPVSIKQANFPPLNSSESRNYRKSVNTQDSSILPEHPHTNAVIKNFNRSLKKLVRTANLNQNIGRMNFLYFYIFYQHMSKREIHNPCYFSKNQSKHIYLHYKKGVCIRSYADLYSVRMRENTDQNNSEYGNLSCGASFLDEIPPFDNIVRENQNQKYKCIKEYWDKNLNAGQLTLNISVIKKGDSKFHPTLFKVIEMKYSEVAVKSDSGKTYTHHIFSLRKLTQKYGKRYR